jgi:hypothetical protein
VADNDSLALIGIPALGGVLALVALLFGLRAGKRQRLVDNLPTSKTAGVFIGLVELKGTAEVEQPLVSYLTASRCVYYRWQIEESWSRIVTETYTDKEGKTQTRTRTESGWTTVASGGEEMPFYLQDDCGVIRIQPAGAKIEPQTVMSHTCGRGDPLYYGKGPAAAVADSDHRRRFVEHAISLHAPLYVVGHAREREDIVAAEIAADKGVPLFLISTRTERQVSRGFRLGFWLLGVIGLALAIGGFVARDMATHREPAQDVPLFVATGLGFLLTWLLGWAWMVYNSLIDLRQRVRQGWANVDVQLKRRHDLIPTLVSSVSGLRDYERTVQTELAALRAQLQVTAPGESGPDPAACLPLLRAVVERYPELKASESFLNLQRQLADTEQRIALARSYFNDIATFYDTRLQVVPDRFVAAMGGLQPQALMAAADFARAPVQVTFAV